MDFVWLTRVPDLISAKRTMLCVAGLVDIFDYIMSHTRISVRIDAVNTSVVNVRVEQ